MAETPSRPLFGRRVVVTRPRAQALELVSQLKQLGAEPIEIPTIQIMSPDDPTPIADACARIGSFDWVVFTSANAVSQVMHRLLDGPGDIRDLTDVRLCAVGPATAAALSMYSLKVDLTPEIYRTEGVVRALCQDRDLTGVRMLLPRGDLARDLLPAELRRAGADVTTVTAYRTVPVDLERADSPDLYQLLLKRRVDIVTFTSESSVKNLVLALGENQSVNLLKGVDIACIGPVTAAVAARLGIPATIIPSESTVSGLVSAIAEHVQAHRHEERV